MLKLLAIALGGALGSLLRYAVFLLVQRPAGPEFPLGTLAANLAGCLLIGFLWSSFEGTRLASEWRLFIFTGFLGGFTTFSTFARETVQLYESGEWKNALLYLSLSNVLGLGLVAAGYALAKKAALFAR